MVAGAVAAPGIGCAEGKKASGRAAGAAANATAAAPSTSSITIAAPRGPSTYSHSRTTRGEVGPPSSRASARKPSRNLRSAHSGAVGRVESPATVRGVTDATGAERPNGSGAPSAPGAPAGVVPSAPLPPHAPGAPAAPAAPDDAAGPVRLTAWVRGRVQGVGFRWFTRAAALRIGGLAGYVSNLDDGRVQVVAEGSRGDAEALLDWLRHGDTPGRVDGVGQLWGPVRGGYEGFGTR